MQVGNQTLSYEGQGCQSSIKPVARSAAIQASLAFISIKILKKTFLFIYVLLKFGGFLTLQSLPINGICE